MTETSTARSAADPAEADPAAADTAAAAGGRARHWTALHAYLHGDAAAIDRFVVGTVGPAVTELLEEGEATSWFFVRYWEGGPHVRVRVADADADAIAGLSLRLRAGLLEEPATLRLDPEEFYGRFGAADAAEDLGWHPHGTVKAVPYEPEVGRYGGPAAMELAEDLFRASSEVALHVLRAAPEGRRRVAIALDLLLGWAHALGFDDAGAVKWLRWYVYGWKYAPEAGHTDEHVVRLSAEAEFDRNEARLVERARAVAEAARGGGEASGLHHAWWSAAAHVHRRLRTLEDAEALTAPAELVAASQLHMFHNRLGLTISEEMYLAWLGSNSIAGGRERVGFFDDAADSADRVYAEHSKFSAVQFARDGLGPHTNGRREPWGISPGVALPPPPPPEQLSAPLGPALAARRSRLGRFEGQMRLFDLAALLGHAAGMRGTQAAETPTGTWEHPKRPYPSAGASYGTFLRVCARHVDGLEAAMYEYDPAASELVPVGELPSPTVVGGASPYLESREGPPLIDVSGAPALVAVCADLSIPRPRYGLRALRFLLLEAGHLAQNLVLVAQAQGWDSTTIGGLFDDGAAQMMQLDGYDEMCVYLVPLGRPTK